MKGSLHNLSQGQGRGCGEAKEEGEEEQERIEELGNSQRQDGGTGLGHQRGALSSEWR